MRIVDAAHVGRPADYRPTYRPTGDPTRGYPAVSGYPPEATAPAHRATGETPAGVSTDKTASTTGPRSLIFPGMLATAVFLFFTIISLWQWNRFVSPSWDLGIFTQLLNQYAHFNEPIVTIKGPGYHLWGDHFHPILTLLTPLFWLFPSGLTLLITQNFLFAISVIPVAWYARKKLGTPGTLLAFAYALSWGLSEAVWVQFHEIAFAVPLLAFGLVAWLEGRRRWAWILIALLVFVKEDLGLTVAAFAAVALWTDWRRAEERTGGKTHRRRLLAWAGLGVWGIAWFLASILWILPTFNTANQWDYTGRLDSEGRSGAVGFLLDFTTPGIKIITVLLLILLGAIVALRSPLFLLVVPTLTWRFAGNVAYYWGWEWHYSAVLMPIVILAAVDGFRLLRARLGAATTRAWEPALAGAALVSAVVLMFQGPLQGMYYNHYVQNPADSRAAIAALPEGSVVASDVRHLAYLVPDHEVYWNGSSGSVVPDYWITSIDSAVNDVDARLKPEAAAQAQASALETQAEQRWGGDWQVQVFGTVAILTHGEMG